MTTDLIILVPGIMGSVLKQGDVPVWNSSVFAATRTVTRFGRQMEALTLPTGLGDSAPDPTHSLNATGLIGGWHVWPGVWIGAGYHGIMTKLQEWYPEPYQFQVFPYDWRLSNRLTAARLKSFTESALEHWRSLPNNRDAEVVFVCHSMGGLIARYYVNALDGHQICRRIITMGTPFSGSTKAVRALAGDFPKCPERLLAAMLSMPSLHQLLPSFRCVRRGHETMTLADCPIPGIASGMAADASALHSESVDPNARTPVHAFAGRFQSTLTCVEVNGASRAYRKTWPVQKNGVWAEEDFGGDATVPSFAATPTEWGDDTGTEYHGARHGALPNRPRLLAALHRKIENLAPASFLEADFEFGLDLPDVVEAGTPVPVRVNPTDQADALNFRASARNLKGEVEIRNMALRPDGSGGYAAELPLPAGTWHVEVALTGQAARTTVADLVVVW